MANPAIVNCTVDTWVAVATNVTAGKIYVLKTDPHIYLITHRLTGNPAPTDNTDAIELRNLEHTISLPAASDVYVKAVGIVGQVRVDL